MSIPVMAQAVVGGLVVLLAGQLPWSALLATNLRLSPGVPWAVAMGL
jgi:hypothetical protein